MDIYERLTPVFRDVFDLDELILSPELTADKVDGWDSLGHVRLIVAIERALKIQLATIEVSNLRNVGQLMELLQKKLS